MDLSKDKVLTVLSTCQLRHEVSSTCKCMDCKYNGTDCQQAHEYAQAAVKLLKVKEVQDDYKRRT